MQHWNVVIFFGLGNAEMIRLCEHSFVTTLLLKERKSISTTHAFSEITRSNWSWGEKNAALLKSCCLRRWRYSAFWIMMDGSVQSSKPRKKGGITKNTKSSLNVTKEFLVTKLKHQRVFAIKVLKSAQNFAKITTLSRVFSVTNFQTQKISQNSGHSKRYGGRIRYEEILTIHGDPQVPRHHRWHQPCDCCKNRDRDLKFCEGSYR